MSILTNGTCLQIRLGRPGTRAKVDTSKINVPNSDGASEGETGATDKSLLHITKDLMDSPELKAIGSHDALTRGWV